MELKPVTFSGGHKSISDDDLCANCKHCEYRPGEMSSCTKDWPGMEDDVGYVHECEGYNQISSPEENFVAPLKGMSLSQLIAALTADLEANGDAENVTIGVCVAQENGQRIRLDALLVGDGSELLRDANYSRGMLCIVADNYGVVIQPKP